jgi:hypothetical protein
MRVVSSNRFLEYRCSSRGILFDAAVFGPDSKLFLYRLNELIRAYCQGFCPCLFPGRFFLDEIIEPMWITFNQWVWFEVTE